MGDWIEALNIFGAFLAGYAIWLCQIWKRGTDESTHNLLVALQWIFAVSFTRGTWFATSRFIAPAGYIWHPTMFEFRITLLAATCAMLGWGIFKVARTVDDAKPLGQIKWVMALAVIATALGFLI
jgi:hypothetical protein